jgi:hypothetical protein
LGQAQQHKDGMRVLIDSLGLQARIHSQDGGRLATFLLELERIPDCAIRFSPPAPLSGDLLGEVDVLVITTRKIGDNPYMEAELAAIPAFVQRGGGLLLMANHGDIPGKPYPNMTRNDALLARIFGIEIENTFFASPEWKDSVEISGADLRLEHPILSGAQTGQPVRSLVTHNCSSLRIGEDGISLVSLPGTMRDYRNGSTPQGRHFAVAADRGRLTGAGRVVVTADSGFIGSQADAQPDLIAANATTRPGFGLIEAGDNLRFIRNTLLWIGTR